MTIKFQGCWKVSNSGGALHFTLPQQVVGKYVINPPKSGGANAPRFHQFQHTWTVLTTKLARHNEKLLYTNRIWLSIKYVSNYLFIWVMEICT